MRTTLNFNQILMRVRAASDGVDLFKIWVNVQYGRAAATGSRNIIA